MERLSRRYLTMVRAGTGLALAALMVGSMPALAEDVCFHAAPLDVAAVRGYTWTGTVVSVRPAAADVHGAEQTFIEFDVEAVHAHAEGSEFPADVKLEAGSRLGFLSHSCSGPTGLREGSRYLATASFLSTYSTTNRFAAWRLDGARATLVEAMYRTGRPPASLSEATSLGEALALVAPGSELPPTDARSDARAVVSTGWPVTGLLFLFLTLAGGMFLQRRRASDLRRIRA